MNERTDTGGRAVTCHSMRHSAACHWLRQGGEIKDVKKILRHKNATTTSAYLHSNLQDLAKLATTPEQKVEQPGIPDGYQLVMLKGLQTPVLMRIEDIERVGANQ